MKKVCVIGHFGFGKNMANGQTIKTLTITNELVKQFGEAEVIKIDTHGGGKALLRSIIGLVNGFVRCENVIILPAQNGVKVFSPLCIFLNKVLHRKIHYVVIGGWLPVYIKNKSLLRKCLKHFDGIYVETNTMKIALKEQSFDNVYILPNFKDLQIANETEMITSHFPPYFICTFSRVMQEKGIEDIVKAVEKVNTTLDRCVYHLDIFGQIDSEQVEWFTQLKFGFPDYIRYQGVVPYDESVDVLKKYFFLAFPTRFFTEGIPGTILDAYAAGVPVVSSRWESFADIIDDGSTGLGYTFNDNEELFDLLMKIALHPQIIDEKKKNCLKKACKYSPQNAMSVLIKKM